MKVNLKNTTKNFTEPQLKTVRNFLQFLQKSLPLTKNIFVSFDDEREGMMTTGVRLPKHHIHVLAKDRLLVDILRSLSHEWTHEFQHQKMGLKDTDRIQDIGGPEENMANSLAGILIKSFMKQFPHEKTIIFGDLD